MRVVDAAVGAARTSIAEEAFRAYLVRGSTQQMVRSLVAAKVPTNDVEDVTQDALLEALHGFERAPPGRSEALGGWLAVIARRKVADFLERRDRRGKYEGELPGQFENPRLDGHPSYDPRETEADDSELEGGRVFRWLEGEVASNARDHETFEIILEHARGDKTYQAIAAERGMTLIALSSRIFEFKQKYIPRYRRRRNRFLLLVLFGAAAVAALVVAWLLSPAPAPAPSAQPSARPPTLYDRLFGPLPVGHGRPAEEPVPSDP